MSTDDANNLSPIVKSEDDLEKECVDQLRQLIIDDPELPSTVGQLDDEILLLLIRARRNRPEVSYKLLKSLIQFKTKQYPDLFENISSTAIQPVVDNEMIKMVKREDDNVGPAVLIFRTAAWNTSETNFDMLIKAGFLYGFCATNRASPKQIRSGIIMVLDMGGFSFNHAKECSYSNVTKLANCIIFGSPFRISRAFLINSPYVFEKVWSVVKFAIPEYFRNFITVTRTDLSKLHELVAPSLLPESLGGSVAEDEGWDEDVEVDVASGSQDEYAKDLLEKIEGMVVVNDK